MNGERGQNSYKNYGIVGVYLNIPYKNEQRKNIAFNTKNQQKLHKD